MRPPAAPRQPRRGPDADQAAVDEPREVTPGRAEPAEPATGRAEPAERRRWLPVRQQPDPSLPQGPGFLERLAEQARARRRLAWRKVLLAVGVLAVLGGIAWALLLSPLLALDVAEVTVSGVGEGTTVPREEVMALVEEHAGTPLTRLDTGALADDVRAITTVRSATVTREWPRGLAVDVVPREPVAAATAEDGLVLLDADGVVVGAAEEAPEGLPRVTVPLEGERAGETLSAVLTVLAELPPDVRAEVDTAGAANPASIRLELTDGAEVLWGSVEESELKAAVLAVLREREASVYDVTVPRAPTLSD
ncbi:cell division protein FtsQ [Georgenia satyanarayanai]|uniref:Cell division protein FtsQ n=1 Tax=Georgenia satyanarayanai TaxID=860221 RepID=A0A2Y9AEV0_9MICO|nr:cell division protein FtsQ/DivIB [Georgenia satyanarayanai]PYF99826.1 cell division protein FtsQ [Georgenia satyanarayanai]SSA41808.1 cell division protein FtsQ [Georgenia satyanarayanai]